MRKRDASMAGQEAEAARLTRERDEAHNRGRKAGADAFLNDAALNFALCT